MAKIKKKFLNSLPFFLIFSLLSMSVIGLVFNFDIGLEQIGNKIGLSVSIPEAEAGADTATTTVTIRNAAPTFVTPPAESPASTSTSPVNVGDSISFTATGVDVELDDYFLLVCDQDGATPANGAAPSCSAGGKQFCVSSAASSSVQAICSYTVEASIVPETQVWVAYLCDDNAIDASCTPTSNSGIGDSGSPFNVNHASILTAVITTVDNQIPGANFTFLASTTDSDILGGADVMTLDICATSVWATSTGCDVGQNLCTGTSTSPNASCSWTSGVPLNDIAYTYYAFVKDDNAMPATGNFASNTYTVANVAPSVSSVVFNNAGPVTLNIKGAPNKIVYASSTSITDDNGCADIVSATGTVYWESATGGANCAANDNDCYQIATCTIDPLSCTGGADVDVNIECSTPLAYYALPTDNSGGNPNSATGWFASIRAFDEALSYASSSPSVELNASAAIDVTQLEIAFGSLIAGTDTGTSNGTTTIVNAGNSPLDSDLQGTDMLKNGVGPEYIGAPQQKFDFSSIIYGSLVYTLASTTPQTIDITAPRPTSTVAVTDDLYWGIAVPVILSGDYSGINTFTAALDTTAPTEW